MRSSRRFDLAAIALLAVMPVGGHAQNAEPAPAAAPDKIDPVAIQALKGMGAYLKTLQSFEIRSKATIVSTVDDTDLQITLGLDNVYRVQRPDKFFVSMTSDRQVRDYYYDGKTFTVNIPRQKFYATVSAPPTIAAVVEDVYEEYGITLPLSDLFTWAVADSPTDGIRTALRVGYAKINNVDTDQFVFRGKDLDFQIWIARGARPLPIKLAIASREDAGRPSYSAELDWKTDAKFTPATFAFRPDASASPVQLARLSTGGQ